MNNYREPNDHHEDEYNIGPTIDEWEEYNDLEDVLYEEWRDDNESE
jgi:hypothetical protein